MYKENQFLYPKYQTDYPLRWRKNKMKQNLSETHLYLSNDTLHCYMFLLQTNHHQAIHSKHLNRIIFWCIYINPYRTNVENRVSS